MELDAWVKRIEAANVSPEEVPEHVLDHVAKLYMSWRGESGAKFERHRALLEHERFHEAMARALGEGAFTGKKTHRIAACLPHVADDDALFDYLTRHKPTVWSIEATRALIERAKVYGLPQRLFCDMTNMYEGAVTRQSVHAAVLVLARGIEGASDLVLESLRYIPHVLSARQCELEVLREAFMRLDEPTRTERVLDAMGEFRRNLAAWFIPMTDGSDETLEACADVIMGYRESALPSSHDGLAHAGAPMARALIARWHNNLSPTHALLLLDTATRAEGVDAAPLAVMALGHKNKPVQHEALATLKSLGEDAREALTVGLEHRLKRVRGSCEELIAALDRGDFERPSWLKEALLAMPNTERDALEQDIASLEDFENVERIDKAYGSSAPDVIAHLVLEAANTQRDNKNLGYLIDRQVRRSMDDAHKQARVWEGFMRFMDFRPKELYRLNENPHWPPCPAEALTEALPTLLEKLSPAMHRIALRNYLTHAKQTSDAILLIAIAHESSSVRDLAVARASLASDSCVTRIIGLLDGGRKPNRICAASALIKRGRLDKDLHHEPLLTAWRKEKDLEVLFLIERAIGASFERAALTFETFEQERAHQISRLKTLGNKKFTAPGGTPRPDLLWRDGEVVDKKSLRGFLMRLSFEGPEHRDEWARQVAALLDPESAAALSAWIWRSVDSKKPKHPWRVYQVSVIGDDALVHMIGPEFGAFSIGRGRVLMEWCVDMLARLGTSAAASWLYHWALAAPKNRDRICAREAYLGTSHRLEDEPARALPASEPRTICAALDALQTRFDLGGELGTGEMIWDEAMKPIFALEDGSTRRSPPRSMPSKAKKQWSEAKKLARDIRRDLIRSLEETLTSRRFWTREAFLSLFDYHPITRDIARVLVFTLEDGRTFRFANGAPVDEVWDEVTIPDGARIQLAHPASMGQRLLDLWGTHFAEGKLMQPFAQLSRAFYSLEAPAPVTSCEGNKLLGRLKRKGWYPEREHDDHTTHESSKGFPAHGLRAILRHDGIKAGTAQPTCDTTLVLSGFCDLYGEPVSLEEVDPALLSEIYCEIVEMT